MKIFSNLMDIASIIFFAFTTALLHKVYSFKNIAFGADCEAKWTG
jgi:hypothetical protein